MAKDNGYDTTFNPNIAALGKPQTNEISAIGKTITDFGKVLQDNEDAELKRKALNTNIAESEQRLDFASKLFPKQMEEANLKIAGQTTANKTSELQYKSADELWRDKKATEYLQGYIKSNGLSQQDAEAMLKNRELNPQQFIYRDVDGKEYELSATHINNAFDILNKQNLETEGTKAKIAESKADAFYKHAAGKAALISAGANAERAANGGKHNISMSSMEKIAQNAANTSTVANSFLDIAKYFDKSRIGPVDYGMAWMTNKAGINTENSKNTIALNASIEGLIGAVKDVYSIKGNISNADMQRIQSMSPNITDSEDAFKEKTMR
ncbi:MAG TPA: hypothetical protein PKW30_07820, partial [Campylobacterales bacterium]|nr:hypothetical protein [Campylobacterales bacterium]